jgi:hypothetical protein
MLLPFEHLVPHFDHLAIHDDFSAAGVSRVAGACLVKQTRRETQKINDGRAVIKTTASLSSEACVAVGYGGCRSGLAAI